MQKRFLTATQLKSGVGLLDNRASIYTQPFGTPFILMPMPPYNNRNKIPMTSDLTFEALGNLIIYELPHSTIEILDVETDEYSMLTQTNKS